MKKLIDKTIKWRYLIALAFFILGLSLNLNGSSSNSWSLFGVSDAGKQGKIVSETEENISSWLSLPPKSDGTVWGIPRIVRTDEWMIQSSFFISQTETDQTLNNPDYGLSKQNMIVAYNSPVKHISAIGKPFNWGALFLSPSRALSWYWCFKVISFILLGFEFCMIITRKNKWLSLVGSFWIVYTPAIQWWFMQHLGDVVWFSLLTMVAVYHFFHAHKKWAKIGFAALLSSSLTGFVLVIYPAFQVVFAYLILGFFLYYFLQALKQRKLGREDWAIIGVTVLFTGSIVIYSLWESKEAILATLNTVYPGSRVSTGGLYKLSHLTNFLINPFLPFVVPNVSNQVELASSLNFLPFAVFLTPLIMKRDKIKENFVGLFFLIYSFIIYAYSIIKIPKFFAKLTLFSFVTEGRAWQAMSVIAVFVSIWFLAYIWREKEVVQQKFFLPVLAAAAGLLAYFAVIDQEYLHYIPRSQMLLILTFLILTLVLAVFRFKKTFAGLVLVGTFLTGFTINPIVIGVGPVENRQLSAGIKKVVNKDEEARWIVDNSMLYNYPQMLGAKTINGVRFYPDTKLMAILDPKNKEEKDWNRYAHTRILLTDAKTSLSTHTSPDVLNVDLNIEKLTQLKVSYILTNRDLDILFPGKFELIYKPDKDNNRIYRYRSQTSR